MHKLYELKEMLCEELEEYGSKDKLDVGGLDIVDKLAHAIKNLDKIIESEDGGYSSAGRSYEGRNDSYRGGRSNRSYAAEASRARRRDSMGRYSYDGYSMAGTQEMVEDLREMMREAPNDNVRMQFQSVIKSLESM